MPWLWNAVYTFGSAEVFFSTVFTLISRLLFTFNGDFFQHWICLCQIPGICVSQIPGIYVSQIPGIYVSQIPGIYVSQIPGIYVSQIPGICVSQIPGIYVSQIPGIYVSQIPGIYGRLRNQLLIFYSFKFQVGLNLLMHNSSVIRLKGESQNCRVRIRG